MRRHYPLILGCILLALCLWLAALPPEVSSPQGTRWEMVDERTRRTETGSFTVDTDFPYRRIDSRPPAGFLTLWPETGFEITEAWRTEGDIIFTTRKTYDQAGRLTELSEMKGSQLHGKWKRFVDGKLRESGTYIEGKKDGPWLEWDDASGRLVERVYKDGWFDLSQP